MNQKRERGFTLLELIISMSIFSLISMMSYGGLKTVLDGREISEKVIDRLAEVEMAMTILKRDVMHMVVKPTAGSDQLEFIRAGRTNPLKQKRSSLQRIRYQISGTSIIRDSEEASSLESFPELQTTEVLQRVKNLTFQIINKESADKTTPSSQPFAIAVIINIEDFGEIRSIISLPLQQLPEKNEEKKES